jgi:hypothetical protein
VKVKREGGVLFGTRANSRGIASDPDLSSVSASRACSPPSAVSLCVHSLSVARGFH